MLVCANIGDVHFYHLVKMMFQLWGDNLRFCTGVQATVHRVRKGWPQLSGSSSSILWAFPYFLA